MRNSKDRTTMNKQKHLRAEKTRIYLCPGYRQVYDRLSGINNFRKVFEEAKGIAEELGDPFEQKKRGRKLKASPKEAGALLIVIRGLNMTFREREYMARELGYELDHIF